MKQKNTIVSITVASTMARPSSGVTQNQGHLAKAAMNTRQQAPATQNIQKPVKKSNPTYCSDPDIAITSGAWLFDTSLAPKWFQDLLGSEFACPKTQFQSRGMSSATTKQTLGIRHPAANEPLKPQTAQYWRDYFNFASAPQKQQANQLQSKSNTVGNAENLQQTKNTAGNNSVPALNNVKRVFQKAKEAETNVCKKPNNFNCKKVVVAADYAIESGLWLFDLKEAPAWFQAMVSPYMLSGQAKHKPLQATSKNQAIKCSKKCTISEQDAAQHYCDNGGWIFDFKSAPSWIQKDLQSLPKTTSTFRSASAKPKEQKFCSSVKPQATSTKNHVASTSNQQSAPMRTNLIQNGGTAQINQHTVPNLKQNVKGPICNNSFKAAQGTQCLKPQNTVGVTPSYYEDDLIDKQWLYAGVMHPNKTYLGRSKESKSASQGKYSKHYY